eukprot:418018_1
MAFQINKAKGYSKKQSDLQKSKYDQVQNDQVVDWINRVMGKQILQKGKDPNYLQKELSNGLLLCEFINKIKPNTIKPKLMQQKVGMNIFDMQRIAAFNKAAQQLGLSNHESFEGGDLRDNNNMTAVLNCIYSFGRICNNKKVAKGGIIAAANKGNKLQDLILDEDDDQKQKNKPKPKRKTKKAMRGIKQKKCDICGEGHATQFHALNKPK